MHSKEDFVLSLCAQAGCVIAKVCAELLASDQTPTEFGTSLISTTLTKEYAEFFVVI